MFDNKFMIIGRGALKKILKLDIHITFYPSDTTHRFQYVVDNFLHNPVFTTKRDSFSLFHTTYVGFCML